MSHNSHAALSILLLLIPLVFLQSCENNGVEGDAQTYTVGGTVSGLVGSGLVLQNNGADDLSISANGPFTFPAGLPDGAVYDVTVKTQPTDQLATVSNGSGTISGADITNVAAVCYTPQTISGSISENTTLSAGGYFLEGNAIIEDGVTLTIDPGAILMFKENAGLDVLGSLTAVGTSQNPIVFTGEQQVRGYWRGIQFHNSNSPLNRLEYVTVEYGGGYDYAYGEPANVALTSSGYPVRASITHCTLRKSGGYGFFLSDKAIVPDFSLNTVTTSTSGAGFVYEESAGNLDNTTTYVGNDKDVVFVQGGYGLVTDQTWPCIDVDYLIDDIVYANAQRLTIAAGARLVFMQDAGVNIYEYGELTAVGTSQNPIVFTGEQQVRGYWRGIQFHNSNSADNRLEYVTVEYGGGYDYAYGEPANVALTSSGYPVRASIAHSSIQHSQGYGICVSVHGIVNDDIQSSNTFGDNVFGDYYHEPPP